MKLFILCVLSLFLVGCTSAGSSVYNKGKVIYVGAKTAYVELDIKSEKLEVLDEVVVTFDKARTAVIESKKKVDANTSLPQEL